jgi:hypothetical protein
VSDKEKIKAAVSKLRKLDPRVIAIRNMIALAKAKGTPGEKGLNGLDGMRGADGINGINGIDGMRGADGLHGAKGLDGLKGEIGAVGPQGEKGEAGMIWRGTYRSDMQYEIGDVVGVSGSAYVCIAATNQAPPVGFGWELLVSRGAQGVRGIKGEAGSGAAIDLPVSIANGGTGQTTAKNALDALLPSQTGKSGYFLQSNGVSPLWNVLAADASTLEGTTLKSTVINSSLTTVGTLAALTVTAPIGGSITGNAATATTAGTVTNPNLTGEVTTSGLAATVTNSAVIGKVLTGYVSGAGTVAATDTILQAIQKLNGNAGGGAAAAGTLTGTTLASNVVTSSLTSVGTLANLTVTNTIVGSVNGNAATATSATSATTAGTVTTAAQPTITSVGTLTSLTTSGVITGTNATASTSSTTGAVILSGGVGIAKDSHINSQRIGVGLLANTTNLAVGANALAATITGGINNTAIGSGCGSGITTGSQNTLLGYAVGTLVTTGAGNCSIGYASLNQNTVGNYNTAMGYGALQNTTASNNTAVGLSALGNITTGALNTAVGREAGCFQADGTTALTTANNSVYLGRDTRGTQSDSNSIVIGYQAIGLGANTTVIGTSATTSAKVWGAVTAAGTLTADAYILSSSGIQAKTASYTLVAADNGKVITMSVATANTLTIPASLAVGFNCTIIQIGAGQTTITASGTTLNSVSSFLKISAQHGSASIISYASDVYNVAGSLSA